MLLKSTSHFAGEKFCSNKYCLIIFSLLFTICSLSFEILGQGTIKNVSFYSKSVKINRGVQIYLPQGYSPQDSTTRYPVIYFLHGAGVDQYYYTQLFGVFNNLIITHSISPLIVVKPDGSIGPWGGSYYTNSELYKNFEDYIVYDLVHFIDSAYNTNASREKRAIMGHSTGAFGAMKLALKHPDIYCSVSAHSGPLDFKHFSDWIPMILAENGGPPVSVYNPYAGGGSSYWTYLFYSMAGAFFPNLTNSPYPVDFPLDSLGNWIDSVWNRWAVHDPALLARNITQSSDLTIFFDCGMQDEFLLYPFNTAFADSLDNLGLTYVFQSFNGDHMTQMYSRFSIGFQFLNSVMNVVIPVELTSFTASANGKEVTLSWSTATELNNQGFEVKRRFGSNDFLTIGSVKGQGTTTSPNNYTFVDKLTDAGKYFYRLKQIDFGGKYEYSQTVEVNWSPFTTYKLEQNYPNPFNPTTTIVFGIPEKGNVRLSILNILGEEIKVLLNEEKEVGYHSLDFDGSNLPSGVYFYQLKIAEFISTKKMILVR
jgi:S-formylglutathione hydrolase FrmB